MPKRKRINPIRTEVIEEIAKPDKIATDTTKLLLYQSSNPAIAPTPKNSLTAALKGWVMTSCRRTARGDWAGRCHKAGRVNPAKQTSPVVKPIIHGRAPANGRDIGNHS